MASAQLGRFYITVSLWARIVFHRLGLVSDCFFGDDLICSKSMYCWFNSFLFIWYFLCLVSCWYCPVSSLVTKKSGFFCKWKMSLQHQSRCCRDVETYYHFSVICLEIIGFLWYLNCSLLFNGIKCNAKCKSIIHKFNKKYIKHYRYRVLFETIMLLKWQRSLC